MAEYRAVDVEQLAGDLTAVADAIRQKAGTSAPLSFPDGMAAAVGSIHAQSGVDTATFASSITFANLNVFNSTEVSVSLPNVASIASLFGQYGQKNAMVERITLTCVKPITSCSAAFYSSQGDDTIIKHITLYMDTSMATTMGNMFYRLVMLETIDGTPLDATSCTNFNNMFGSCKRLKDVRFKAGSIHATLYVGSKCLSNASIRSVVGGLSDNESGKTLTLSQEAVNNAFETAAGVADGSTSAEWLALIGDCPNWTITLE